MYIVHFSQMNQFWDTCPNLLHIRIYVDYQVCSDTTITTTTTNNSNANNLRRPTSAKTSHPRNVFSFV